MSIVVAHRDPDWSNEYVTFGAPVEIFTLDYGRADLRDPEEFAEWAESHLATVRELYERGTPEAIAAGDHIAQAVVEARLNYHGEPDE